MNSKKNHGLANTRTGVVLVSSVFGVLLQLLLLLQIPVVVDGYVGNAILNKNLLMIGNSYTDANNLEETLVMFLKEDRPLVNNNNNIYAIRFEKGAANLHNYSTDGQLQNMFSERKWTWVVLQDQSQTPGFYDTQFNNLFEDGRNAVTELNNKILQKSDTADTILLMTWGRANGDGNNPNIYPNYLTMQNRIAEGYYRYRDAITTPERPVKIAPAGLAFQAIYNDTDSNYDRHSTPTERRPTSFTFFDLYDNGDTEGSHPSVYGSYVTACVIYATISGYYDADTEEWIVSTRALPGMSGMSGKTRAYLQSIAFYTVRTFYESPEQKQIYFYEPLIKSKTHPTQYDEQTSKAKQPYKPPSSSSSSSSMVSKAKLVFVVALMAVAVLFVQYKKRQQDLDIYIRRNTVHTTDTSNVNVVNNNVYNDAVELTSFVPPNL